MIRESFARKAGWKGQPVLQSLHTTWGQVKEWQTEAYHVPLVYRKGNVHRVLAYSIEIICQLDHMEASWERWDVQSVPLKLKSAPITINLFPQITSERWLFVVPM